MKASFLRVQHCQHVYNFCAGAKWFNHKNPEPAIFSLSVPPSPLERKILHTAWFCAVGWAERGCGWKRNIEKGHTAEEQRASRRSGVFWGGNMEKRCGGSGEWQIAWDGGLKKC